MQPHTPTEQPTGFAATGWSATLLGPDLIEYRHGRDVCLVNVAFEPVHQSRTVYASEAESPWFPDLKTHLQRALPQLSGQFKLA